MKINKKIAGFTMIDILTGMVIMSIIIAMVFYLFTALNKQVYDYGLTRNEINSYLMLKTDLNRRFDTSEEIKGIPRGIQLTNGSETFKYVKDETILLRVSRYATDTLTTELHEMNIRYLTTENGRPTEFVTSLALKINIHNQELYCHFHKDYGIINQINAELLNEL